MAFLPTCTLWLWFIRTAVTAYASSVPGGRRDLKGETMKKTPENEDMLDEYDFSKGVRGKYARQYHQGTNIIVLEPDVAAEFPNSEAVNQALRSIAALTRSRT